MSRARLAAVCRIALPVLVTAHPLSARQARGQTGPEPSAYLVVIASRLNIREAPTLDARVVGSAARGERLCALRYQGDWAEVRTPGTATSPAGRTRGFVSRGFVSETRATREQLQAMGCGAEVRGRGVNDP